MPMPFRARMDRELHRSRQGHPLNKLTLLVLGVTFSVCLQAQLPVPLGSAGTFAVLAGSTVTNTGPTIVNGDVGVSPLTAVTGFPPGSVVGGTIHRADGSAGTAQGDLTTAFNNAAVRPPGISKIGEIGGQTLPPGVYTSTGSLQITGILRLDGGGNGNSVFIFQIASTLTTASVSQVILQGGARASNIFWQVGSSATLGTNSIFNGTILAQASITITTGAALNGRALARTGAVTLDTNTVVNPGLAATVGPPSALAVTCPLGAAQIGVAYNSLLVATGGTPPYTFSTGALPPGLNLNASTGAVTGTPTGGGSTFVANAADSAVPALTATNNCSITTTVANPPTIPALSTWGMGLLALLLAGYAVQFIRKAHPRSMV